MRRGGRDADEEWSRINVGDGRGEHRRSLVEDDVGLVLPFVVFGEVACNVRILVDEYRENKLVIEVI